MIFKGDLSIKRRAADTQINCKYVTLGSDIKLCHQMDGLVGDSLSFEYKAVRVKVRGVRALSVGGFCGRRSTEARKEAD